MKQNTILFIGHLWPEPTSSAAGYRTLALLKSLSEHWQITFACAAEMSEYCADLEALNIEPYKIKLNHSSFDQYLSALQPDIVFYDRFISEEQFAPRVQQCCPDAINILDTQDLHFLRRARQKAFNNQQKIHLKSDDAIREIAAIVRSDLSLIISSYEMNLLIKQFTISPDLLHYCPFMLSTGNNESSVHYDEREHFVMIGNFLHPPNWDAVLWCYQSIWPEIRQQLPNAQIHIYGAYAPEKVWQLHQPEKGFIIKGRADDAVKTLSQYRVNLAPLRFGAGIKGKIVDGFMAGTPCITTDIGREGMADNLHWGGLISEDIQDEKGFAEKAITLYSNKTLWQQCRDFGYQIIEKKYNEKQHAEQLIKQIHQLENQLSTHRKKNFYGQILRHNLYRSQYFMSKWIEEKNKKIKK